MRGLLSLLCATALVMHVNAAQQEHDAVGSAFSGAENAIRFKANVLNQALGVFDNVPGAKIAADIVRADVNFKVNAALTALKAAEAVAHSAASVAGQGGAASPDAASSAGGHDHSSGAAGAGTSGTGSSGAGSGSSTSGADSGSSQISDQPGHVVFDHSGHVKDLIEQAISYHQQVGEKAAGAAGQVSVAPGSSGIGSFGQSSGASRAGSGDSHHDHSSNKSAASGSPAGADAPSSAGQVPGSNGSAQNAIAFQDLIDMAIHASQDLYNIKIASLQQAVGGGQNAGKIASDLARSGINAKEETANRGIAAATANLQNASQHVANSAAASGGDDQGHLEMHFGGSDGLQIGSGSGAGANSDASNAGGFVVVIGQAVDDANAAASSASTDASAAAGAAGASAGFDFSSASGQTGEAGAAVGA